MRTLGLEGLPAELLYEIQLFALSEALPNTSKHLRNVFKATTPNFRARYILGRTSHCLKPQSIFSRALQYPICSKEVLEVFLRGPGSDQLLNETKSPELPKRLFRSLAPKEGLVDETWPKWIDREHPLPYLKYLYETPGIPRPDPNSHDGYALTRAVHAGFVPLIHFLLVHGASPECKKGLAVMVAIRRKDLSVVRMLVERPKGTAKRRKLEDRVQTTSEMLRVAVKCDARDIAEYLTLEKGCIPDMQTLRMMH